MKIKTPDGRIFDLGNWYLEDCEIIDDTPQCDLETLLFEQTGILIGHKEKGGENVERDKE